MKRDPSEYNKHKESKCTACGSSWVLDIDHIKTLGSGGNNHPSNCMTLCRFCHIEKGQKGIKHMAKKYDNYLRWLILNGWELCKGKGKYVNYKIFLN